MSIFPKLLKFRIELMFIKVNFSKFFLIIKVFSLIISLSLFVMISPFTTFPYVSYNRMSTNVYLLKNFENF